MTLKQNLVFSLYQNQQLLIQETIESTYLDQTLQFKQGEMSHILDLEKETFLRENEKYSFFLDVKNKKCHMHLKKENNTLQVSVIYAIILQNKNEMELSYKIETQEEEIKMKLIMLGGNEL